jgi:hypothetical protein
MMAANIAPLFQHGESLARLTAAGGLFVFPVRKPYLRQASRPPLVFFLQRKRRGRVNSAVGAGSGRARNGLFVAGGLSADRAALAPSP